MGAGAGAGAGAGGRTAQVAVPAVTFLMQYSPALTSHFLTLQGKQRGGQR